jgi:dynein intermediate chain, cytosolic
MTPRFIPDLIDVEQELFELPQKVCVICVPPISHSLLFQERLMYNKDVQTTAIETDSPGDDEHNIRERVLRERELEAERIARDKELEEESVQLEKEIEQEIRGWSISFTFMILVPIHLVLQN